MTKNPMTTPGKGISEERKKKIEALQEAIEKGDWVYKYPDNFTIGEIKEIERQTQLMKETVIAKLTAMNSEFLKSKD